MKKEQPEQRNVKPNLKTRYMIYRATRGHDIKQITERLKEYSYLDNNGDLTPQGKLFLLVLRTQRESK